MQRSTRLDLTRRLRYFTALLAAFALAATATACSSDEEKKATKASDETSESISEDNAEEAEDDTSKEDDAEDNTDDPAEEYGAIPWETIAGTADCKCSDGSPYEYYVRKADPKKVLFFLQGGGACFDGASCAPDTKRFTPQIGEGSRKLAADGTGNGIFDYENPNNPLADYSVVYAPYCTGDVHIGTATHDYGDGVVVEHKGRINASTARAEVKKQFPDAETIVVAGESAGSIPTPLYAAELSDDFPDAQFTVIADGSGGYPNEDSVIGFIGGLWGIGDGIPDWPELEGIPVEKFNFAEVFISANKRNPNIVMTRHDYSFDQTQLSFSALAGFSADQQDKAMLTNEGLIEDGDVNLLSYQDSGARHTVLSKPGFYTDTLNGVRYLDWITAILNREELDGSDPADVHCVDCVTEPEGSTVATAESSSSAG